MLTGSLGEPDLWGVGTTPMLCLSPLNLATPWSQLEGPPNIKELLTIRAQGRVLKTNTRKSMESESGLVVAKGWGLGLRDDS